MRSIITKKYRAEIDGLRAVAILPVVLFHADYDIFSGGYVGVVRNSRDMLSLYSDGDHVSNYGAMQMRPVFEPMFQRITRDQLGSQNAKRPQIAELPEESESRR